MQALDTNVLAYAAGLRRVPADDRKIEMAEEFVQRILAEADAVIPSQVLAELHNVLRLRSGRTTADCARIVLEYAASAIVVATDREILRAAFDLSGHGLQTYDAIIVAAAARAGCDILYSEDMQHGFEWEGVMIVNPFA